MERIEHPLPPVYDKNSKVLILGTMPSPKSREYGFYYSHPQNRFWRVLSELFGERLPETNEEKAAFVLRRHIALWDVLKSCEIRGADDSSIRSPVPNDFSEIFQTANITAVFTTGKKAEALYRRLCFPQTHISAVYLPSTSPANCRNTTLTTLKEAYQIVVEQLSRD